MNLITPINYFWFASLWLFFNQAYSSFGVFGFDPPAEEWWVRGSSSIFLLLYILYLKLNQFNIKKPHAFFYLIAMYGVINYCYVVFMTPYKTYYMDGFFILALACSSFFFHRLYLIAYLTLCALAAMTLNHMIDAVRYDKFLFDFHIFLFCFFLLVFQWFKIYLLERLSSAYNSLHESQKTLEKNYQANLQAAHDLKSPLTAINIVAETIYQKNEKGFNLLFQSIARINAISDSLLLHHKDQVDVIERDFFDLENEISKIVNEKRKEFSNVAGFALGYYFSSPLLKKLRIPKTEFERILSNLINNSIEAMSHQSEKKVELSVTPFSDHVVVHVSDNGPGVPIEIQSRIFEMNYSTKQQGTGLGLYHAQKTLKSWGGSITLSKSSPKGSTFSLHIPY